MALTKAMITANATLAGLTEEQITAITTLSLNDESTVIGARIGEIYRDMDSTIANASGIQRNGDEKTYKYLERAIKELNEKAASVDGLNKQISSLTKDKERLEKAIAEGASDAETKAALTQARKDLEAVRKQYTELQTEYDTAKTAHASELLNIRVDNEITAATAGLKFRKEIPESAAAVIMQNAVAKIKGMNPEFIDDGKGGKVLAFKDDTGAIRRNPANQLNVYTAGELIHDELKKMGVLDDAKPAAGGGTGNPVPRNTGGVVDISGARTQSEAYEAIATSLNAQGLVNGSTEFQTAMDKAWADNDVKSLPVQ